jgi:drug/metabolite transporter (DMT)-like permease
MNKKDSYVNLKADFDDFNSNNKYKSNNIIKNNNNKNNNNNNNKEKIDRKFSNLSDYYFENSKENLLEKNQDHNNNNNNQQAKNLTDEEKLKIEEKEKSNNLKGLLILIFSVFMMSLSNLLSKYLSTTSPKLENLTVNFFRGIYFVIFSLLGLNHYKIPYMEEINKSKSKFIQLLIRCFFGACSNILLFACFRHMRISSGFTIFCTYPIFVSVISIIYLKSSFCLFDFLSYIFCSFAVVMISKPAFIFGDGNNPTGATDTLFGVFLAFLSAILNALGVIINKTIALDFHFLSSALFFGVFFISNSLILLPFSQYGLGNINFNNFMIMTLLSSFFYIGLCGFVIALNIGNPVKILPGTYAGIVFSLFYNAFIFNNPTDFLDLLGTGIIILFNLLGSMGIRF